MEKRRGGQRSEGGSVVKTLANVPPQMARRSVRTIPLPANYMLRLTSHILFPTNADFIEKVNML